MRVTDTRPRCAASGSFYRRDAPPPVIAGSYRCCGVAELSMATERSRTWRMLRSRKMSPSRWRRSANAARSCVRRCENEQITRALRESEAKFRGVVGQSFVGIGTIEDGKLGYTNAKFDEIFGYAAGELRGLTPVELTIEEDRPLVAEAVTRRMRGETDVVQSQFAAGARMEAWLMSRSTAARWTSTAGGC